MPPIKLLVGDNKFYGKIKPEGPPLTNTLYSGTNKAPPNPLTPNIRYRTEQAQEIAKDKLNKELADPEPKVPETLDPVKDQQGQQNNIVENKEDVKDYVEKQKSLGQRFTDFLQGEIVETTQEAKEQQKKRELGRIGVAEDPIVSTIRPVGEVPLELSKKAGDFLFGNIQQIFLLGAGLFLLSSFLQNPALLDRRSAKRNYTKKTAIAEK